MKLSIIIPAYNEENTIYTMLEKLHNLILPYKTDKEIVVINDCSKDNTENVIFQFKKEHPEFVYLYFKQDANKGKGAAVKFGIEQSKGEIIIIQDADLELNPNDIPRMVTALIELNIEFINGSRYLAGIVRPLSSYKRYLLNRFFTFLTSIIINVKITDMACGYKLFTRNLYNKVSLKENRFGFEAELIIKALRIKRNNIAEVPVQYFPRNNGEGKKIKNIDGFKILWTIIKYGLLRKK